MLLLNYISKNIHRVMAFSALFILLTNVLCGIIYANNEIIVDSLLDSPDFLAHKEAVDRLTLGPNVDTSTATSVLLNSLQKEISNPTSNAMATGSYFTITNFIQHHYMLGLSRLGKITSDSIYSKLNSATDTFKNRLIIILALMNDKRIHSRLDSLYVESKDPFIRYETISALRTFKDTSDIPIFISALSDDYYVIGSGYVNNNESTREYLIKAQAAGALMEFGLKINRHGGIYTIDPKK